MASEVKARAAGQTSIAKAYRDRVEIRGFDLCDELIGHIGFTEYFLVLLMGRKPDPVLSKLVDATLVAIAEHGLVPSVQAARMTYTAAPNALQGGVAAGLLGCGPVILGAAGASGEMLRGIIATVDQGEELEAVCREALTALRENKQAVPGFGHPLHKPEDPRAWRLIEYAQELGAASRHIEALLMIHKCLPDSFGRALPLNVSGGIAATLLDGGFPPEVLMGVPLLARTAGLLGHLLEEQQQPIGFKLANGAEGEIEYVPLESNLASASERSA